MRVGAILASWFPTESIARRFMIAAGCAVAFRELYLLNMALFSYFEFASGVHWVFLPSGLRLLFVLLFGGWGALGVIGGSVIGGLLDAPFGEDKITTLVAGVLSGLAPLVAREICLKLRWLRDDLRALDAPRLLALAGVFSVVSALLHEVWFVMRGVSTGFLAGFAVLQIGDLMGTLLVLYSSRMLLRMFLRHNPG